MMIAKMRACSHLIFQSSFFQLKKIFLGWFEWELIKDLSYNRLPRAKSCAAYDMRLTCWKHPFHIWINYNLGKWVWNKPKIWYFHFLTKILTTTFRDWTDIDPQLVSFIDLLMSFESMTTDDGQVFLSSGRRLLTTPNRISRLGFIWVSEYLEMTIQFQLWHRIIRWFGA